MRKVSVFSKKLGSKVTVELNKEKKAPKSSWEAWINAGWGNWAPVCNK
ncbi:MAG: hypothetical protein IPH20_12935 [Bacteroidales bacterium]|nr:hypothetical protein [Bacteroidales bacterium]